MKDFETVLTNYYIKYEVSGQVHHKFMSESVLKGEPFSNFLGKKVGDQILIQNKITNVLDTVTIIRINDKYIALLEEILLDAKNPVSGLRFQSLDFGEGHKVLDKKLIELFGIRGSLEKERVEKQYQLYLSGSLSFTELTNSVFNGNFIDCYYNLTTYPGKIFKAISPAIGNHVHTDVSKYVLDFTSLCLFYDLTKDSIITSATKFVISTLVVEEINSITEETLSDVETSMSLSITKKNIRYIEHDDLFRERRLDFLKNLLRWIEDNCVVDSVPESLDMMMGEAKKISRENFTNMLIQIRLMADRENYFLLTNDTFYYRSLKANTNKVISPICFLQTQKDLASDKYLTFMLNRNFVGIPISESILSIELTSMLGNKDNRFLICLENLRYNWNPDLRNLDSAVAFIKNLYTSSLIPTHTRDSTTFAV